MLVYTQILIPMYHQQYRENESGLLESTLGLAAKGILSFCPEGSVSDVIQDDPIAVLLFPTGLKIRYSVPIFIS